MKAIRRIIRDVPRHWVGDGFPVQSLFSYAEAEDFDPFLLLDYAQPYRFAPGAAPRGVGEHPHRGFETVTIVYQGELAHRDSGGNHGSIGPGDVQWMTAARGVVHEEFHSEQFTKSGGIFEVAQLWVNLPARAKLSPPKYQGILASQIPVVSLPGDAGSLRVIAGDYNGTRGPASTFTPVEVWDLALNGGGSLSLPLAAGHTAIAVVQHGQVALNDKDPVAGLALVLFERAGEGVSVRATSDARLLILGGQPIGEPVVGQGPFVMNTRDEIRQAILDFQSGEMGRLA